MWRRAGTGLGEPAKRCLSGHRPRGDGEGRAGSLVRELKVSEKPQVQTEEREILIGNEVGEKLVQGQIHSGRDCCRGWGN